MLPFLTITRWSPCSFLPIVNLECFLRYKQIGLSVISASLALGCVIGVLYYAITINTTAAAPFKYGCKTRSRCDYWQSWIVHTNYLPNPNPIVCSTELLTSGIWLFLRLVKLIANSKKQISNLPLIYLVWNFKVIRIQTKFTGVPHANYLYWFFKIFISAESVNNQGSVILCS